MSIACQHPRCTDTFPTVAASLLHARTAHTSFPCLFCPFAFATAVRLDEHTALVHYAPVLHQVDPDPVDRPLNAEASRYEYVVSGQMPLLQGANGAWRWQRAGPRPWFDLLTCSSRRALRAFYKLLKMHVRRRLYLVDQWMADRGIQRLPQDSTALRVALERLDDSDSSDDDDVLGRCRFEPDANDQPDMDMDAHEEEEEEQGRDEKSRVDVTDLAWMEALVELDSALFDWQQSHDSD